MRRNNCRTVEHILWYVSVFKTTVVCGQWFARRKWFTEHHPWMLYYTAKLLDADALLSNPHWRVNVQTWGTYPFYAVIINTARSFTSVALMIILPQAQWMMYVLTFKHVRETPLREPHMREEYTILSVKHKAYERWKVCQQIPETFVQHDKLNSSKLREQDSMSTVATRKASIHRLAAQHVTHSEKSDLLRQPVESNTWNFVHALGLIRPLYTNKK